MSIVCGYQSSAVFFPESEYNFIHEDALGVPLTRRAVQGSASLSLEELWLINSALGQSDPFGISLDFQQPLATQAYRSELLATQKSLIQKGILQDEAHFSPLGVVMARTLREYKKALRHVFIDDAHIAVTAEGFCVILRKEPRGCYDMCVMPSKQLCIMLGMSFPCLRKEILAHSGPIRPLVPRTQEPLRIRIYQHKELISYCTYSPEPNGCTRLNHKSKLAQYLAPQDIWHALEMCLG